MSSSLTALLGPVTNREYLTQIGVITEPSVLDESLLSIEQLKAQFNREGKTFTGWARDNGYRIHAVYLVLNGQSKCLHGKGHEIAVKLGLKPAAQPTTSH